MTDKPKNLHQRLLDVTRTAGQTVASGKNQYGVKAIGIKDTENAIRDALAEHGVLTRWTYVALEDISNGKLWQAHLRVRVVNADNPEDWFEDEWIDIGTSPMAATSFARKGYYKSLFHITEEEDETKGNTVETQRREKPTTPKPQPQQAQQPQPNGEAIQAKLRATIERYAKASQMTVPQVVKQLKAAHDVNEHELVSDKPAKVQMQMIDELEAELAKLSVGAPS